MIDAKRDRLDYGKQLAPPVGYEFDQALGTTYSIDLEAILLIPVALFFAEDLDINPNEIRDDTLEALVEVSKKVTIYHQRGKIKVPEQYSQLIAYWEKGLCPIHLDSYVKSFHPKIWIIRFTEINGKKIIYRIISTSRNLTFSRDWDLAVTTEGIVDTKLDYGNDSLIDFLNFLNKFKKVPKEFKKELPYVNFETLNGFKEIVFHPIGIKDSNGDLYKNPITLDRYKKDFRLIMSPFLDNNTVNLLVENCDESVIFSSDYELSKLSPEILEKVTRKYMFSPFIEEAENSMEMSESGILPMSQNLHAKYFIVQRGGSRSWFIGSANATNPAHERNVEFLIELKKGNYHVRPQLIEEALTNFDSDGIGLFEEFHGNTIEEIEADKIWQNQLRRLIYDLCSIKFSADVSKNENDTYDLVIKIPKGYLNIPENVEIKIKPLPEQSLLSEKISFEGDTFITKFKGYHEVELSPFLVVELWGNDDLVKKFIVDMDIDLDQFTNRMNRIFSNIINNKSRFLSYLSFLLSEASPSIIEDDNDSQNIRVNSRFNGISFFKGTPIYEKLLVAASRNPSKLNKINKLVNRIKDQQVNDGSSILDKDFEEMWEIFKPFLKS